MAGRLTENESIELWLNEQLRKFLNFENVEEIADHLLNLPNDTETIKQSVEAFCGKSKATARFADKLSINKRKYVSIRRPEEMGDDVILLKKKEEEDEEVFWGGNGKKKNEKNSKSTSNTNQSNPSNTKTFKPEVISEETRGNFRIKTTTSKPKEQKGGRCNCQAVRHPLIGNCISCGKIICELEGFGPCSFCGHENFDKRGKRNQNLAKPETLEKAIKHKDKLIEYEKNSAKRTVIYDDQSDYWTNNNWLNPKEKDDMIRKEKEERQKKEEEKRKFKITFDFAGRQVVTEEKNYGMSPISATSSSTPSSSGKEEIKEELLHSVPSSSSSTSGVSVGNNLVCSGVPFRPEFILSKKNAAEKKEKEKEKKSSSSSGGRVQHDYYAIESENVEDNSESKKKQKTKSFSVCGMVEGPSNFSSLERKSINSLFAKNGKMNHYLYCLPSETNEESWKASKYSLEEEKNVERAFREITEGTKEFQFNVGVDIGKSVDYDSSEEVSSISNKISSLFKSYKIDHFTFMLQKAEALSSAHKKKFKSLGVAQSSFLKKIADQVQQSHSSVSFYVYPTKSFGDLQGEQLTLSEMEYFSGLNNGLNPNFVLFFHGPQFVNSQLTTQFAQKTKQVFGERRVILWDNFPLGDPNTSSLIYTGAYDGREPGIEKYFEGALFHPLQQSLSSSLFSLYTSLDFVKDPSSYQPDHSLQSFLNSLAKDDRVGHDLFILLSSAPRPSTPFIDRNLPSGLVEKRLQSKSFFQDLLDRIERLKLALVDSQTSLLEVVKPSIRLLCKVTEAFCDFNLSRFYLDEINAKPKEQKTDKEYQRMREEAYQKYLNSQKSFESLLQDGAQ